MTITATVTGGRSAFGPILFTGDFCRGIREAAKIGYKGVELHIRDPHTIDIKKITAELADNFMRLTTIGTGLAYVDEKLFFTSDDKAIRDAAVKRVCDHIDVFSEMKPIIILGTIKGKIGAASRPEDGKRRILDCTKSCCEYAEKKNMHICIEAINRYEQDCMNTLSEVARFIEEVGSSALLLHIDTFHMNIEEASAVNAIRNYAKYIGHVHVADNNRLPPGGGGIKFPEIFEALRQIGYGGAVAVECLPKPDGPTAAKNAFAYVSSLMNYL